MTHTIGMISLGCAKNQVNAEHMLWLLRQAGYEISPDPDGAELVIVNTCGFIESAKTEAIDNILAMAQLKAEGRIQKILVTGCLAQRYQEEILKELPEVDGVLGTGSYYDVANAVGQVLSGKRYKRFDDINAAQSEDGRILTTPEYYAYLKIAEGCAQDVNKIYTYRIEYPAFTVSVPVKIQAASVTDGAGVFLQYTLTLQTAGEAASSE